MRVHRQTARPGEPQRFEQPKVLVKDTSSDFSGTFDDQNYYVKDVLIVIPGGKKAPYDLKFVTGVVNSKALKFFYRTTFQTIHVQCGELSSLPLPRLDMSKLEDRKRHDSLVSLAAQMLDAKQQEVRAGNEAKRDFWTRKAMGLDRQIDSLVYGLYGLTSEEIALVEGRAETILQTTNEEVSSDE